MKPWQSSECPAENLPERELWLSVLLRAVLDLFEIEVPGAKGEKKHIISRSARAWFDSIDPEPASCRWICENLGLPWRTIRRRALALCANEVRRRIAASRQEAPEAETVEKVGSPLKPAVSRVDSGFPAKHQDLQENL